MSRPKSTKVRFEFQLESELDERIKKWRADFAPETPISGLVRQAIEEYMENHGLDTMMIPRDVANKIEDYRGDEKPLVRREDIIRAAVELFLEDKKFRKDT